MTRKAAKNKNPFISMESQLEVPIGLKDKVMTSITLAHLVGDLSELFTSRMGLTASKMIDFEDKSAQKNDPPER